jgi:hypothetical protein
MKRGKENNEIPEMCTQSYKVEEQAAQPKSLKHSKLSE